ncbi:hypothetical protein ASE00_11865 [Sphingomonas sp. Root710]|uniref:NAD(P)/FAD-dependent oxidoreductase n=1 Tax=Sphingomonas sp. Root710 TaxID=1736594 RepID=UPI0006F631F7|nr:FAD-binding oxidoreductase [Sphingomonas sp. Root710]KRB82723.1 hypothetical protein ASE00_11865 [Sphingomonas sp. Root710]
MERRTFLGLAASAGLASFLPGCAVSGIRSASASSGGRLRIGVVGGGILGASIAMYCARAGADVTLMEKTRPAAGATSKSLAWINPFINDKHYMGLRLESIKRWRSLDKPLGIKGVWGGHVGFTDKAADKGRFDIQSRYLGEFGFPTKMLDRAELKRISPDIDPGNLMEAYFSEVGGHVDPVHATACYLAAATSAGARIVYPCEITAIEPGAGDSGVKVATSRGPMQFDRLIVVAGVDSPALLAPLGYKLPLQYSPGALVHSKPIPILTRAVYDGPSPLEWKQAANGSIVGLEVSTPPRIPVHQEGILKYPMEFPPGIDVMHGTRILSKFAAYQPAVAKAEFGHMTLGFRPMPTDGMPIVGPVPGVPNVSLCVTHSGVTLAPVLGEFMANEVLYGREEPLLAPYRPNRSLPAPKPA